MSRSPLIQFTDAGFYCGQAGVYIDPWRAVDKAIITHAHSDHARGGHNLYIAHRLTVPVLRLRLGRDIRVRSVEYGETMEVNGVTISFHPAGHIPGSAQIRLEYQGEIWVLSGDYKLNHDGISTPFEPVKCHHFVSESTFGLPVFRWEKPAKLYADINAWWAVNAEAGRCSIIYGYPLGKAQRLLYAADASIGPVYVHGTVENTNECLRAAGLALPMAQRVVSTNKKDYRQALVIAPPSAAGAGWLNRFEPYVTGVASGWMNLRGARRRGAIDRGFVVSDHADWTELNTAVKATGAEHIYITHGYTAVFVRWLRENGMDAREVSTRYEGELSEINEQQGGETTGETT